MVGIVDIERVEGVGSCVCISRFCGVCSCHGPRFNDCAPGNCTHACDNAAVHARRRGCRNIIEVFGLCIEGFSIGVGGCCQPVVCITVLSSQTFLFLPLDALVKVEIHNPALYHNMFNFRP